MYDISSSVLHQLEYDLAFLLSSSVDLKTIFGGSVLNQLVSSETSVPYFDTLLKMSPTLN